MTDRGEMKVMVSGRAAGKTTKLVEAIYETLEENPLETVWLCTHSHVDADRLRRSYFPTAGATSPRREAAKRVQIIPWSDPERLRGSRGPIFVDNVDLFLAQHFQALPQAVTMTGELWTP